MLCNTQSTACWTNLSSNEATPSGRCRPSDLGIQTRREGFDEAVFVDVVQQSSELERAVLSGSFAHAFQSA
jgi:hypothetical protein